MVRRLGEAGQLAGGLHNLVHAHPTASFGDSFEVRGNRLFIDSPLEEAAYVFVRDGGKYRQEARLPDEPE